MKVSRLILFLALAAPILAQSRSVTITWIASTTPGVTYNVLHSPAPSGPFTPVNTAPITGTTFTDTTNLSGFWAVESIDSNGDSSVLSNEATIPNAPTGVKAVAN